VRVATESVLQSVVTTTLLDEILTSGRKAVEQRVKGKLQQRLESYRAGVEIRQVRLLDVHPSLEVVDSFREVAGAYEEKNRLINEAEGYRNEQIALARGNAAASLLNAKGYSLARKDRASGDASRFTQAEAASRTGPAVTETRLYLETMEQVLRGRSKMIVDSTKGRRHLTIIDDGIGLLPAAVQPYPVQQYYPEEESEGAPRTAPRVAPEASGTETVGRP